MFSITLALLLALGLGWNYTRPAEYRATSRLHLDLPQELQLGTGAVSGVATKMQWLTSPTVLGKVAQGMPGAASPSKDAPVGEADALRSLLQLQQVPGSDVVELTATGPDPRLLADLLNALPAVARAELLLLQGQEADRRLEAARAELARLEKLARERRAQLEAFRARTGVLAEREDNEAVVRSRNLAQALGAATEKEAAAAGRLKSLSEAQAAGVLGSGLRADSTVGALEARAGQVREELREMERSYTPEFLAMDPKAGGLRTRLAELERQIVQQRAAVQQNAVQQAMEEHAAALAQLERLRARAAEQQPALARTQGKLTESKVIEDDLAQVEKARREVLERVTRLEANEERRVATLTVVESAAVPTRPLRPDYGRDALLVLGAAFALALVVTGTVELFHRTPAPAGPTPTTVVVQPAWPGGHAPRALGAEAVPPGLLAWGNGTAEAVPALEAPLLLLSQPEVAALLAAADGMSRRLCVLALLGLTAAEAAALQMRDVHDGELLVGGTSPRKVRLPAWFVTTLPGQDAGLLVSDPSGRTLAEDEMAAMIVSAALDAGLTVAPAVGAETLRNTYIGWLLEQGLRYADLPSRVGRVGPTVLQAFATRFGVSPRRDDREVESLMPALRVDPALPSAT